MSEQRMSFLQKKIDNLKVIVFDLDYTLWPFWVDTHVTPPFEKRSNGHVYDCNGHRIKHYKEVPQVLERLHKLGYKLAIASRTSEIEGANQLLELFGWKKYLSFYEIYPGCKITHILKIAKDSGAQSGEMLFFDDEMRNIRDIESIQTKSILVDEGVSLEVVSAGIKNFVERNDEQSSD